MMHCCIWWQCRRLTWTAFSNMSYTSEYDCFNMKSNNAVSNSCFQTFTSLRLENLLSRLWFELYGSWTRSGSVVDCELISCFSRTILLIRYNVLMYRLRFDCSMWALSQVFLFRRNGRPTQWVSFINQSNESFPQTWNISWDIPNPSECRRNDIDRSHAVLSQSMQTLQWSRNGILVATSCWYHCCEWCLWSSLTSGETLRRNIVQRKFEFSLNFAGHAEIERFNYQWKFKFKIHSNRQTVSSKQNVRLSCLILTRFSNALVIFPNISNNSMLSPLCFSLSRDFRH